ncbi:hypothetical protein ANO11243_049700 [Dothideomycetidae sp. 11243]|nr:hypothetical protein ANO11243_049700 [fungal sp. No.11243]
MSADTPMKLVIGTQDPSVQYTERPAVRVVVRDSGNRIVIIKVKKGSYYKLPGGETEADEDHLEVAEREVAEETGCKIRVEGSRIAMTEEYRNDLHQISYCYKATLVEKVGEPVLTEEELEDGLSHVWLPYAAALKVMNDAEPTSELGVFIKERDVFLLTAAGSV